MNLKIRYINDAILLLSVIVAAVSGVLLFFGVRSFVLRKIHTYDGLVMAVTVIMHIFMNWKVFMNMSKNFFKKKEVE